MAKPERARAIERFLARAGWAEARRTPLAGDASFRRYERLDGTRGRAVLMDAPPPEEDVRPFAALSRHLCSLGLSAPRVLAADEGIGLLLLEDLGDDLYTRLLAEGAAEEAELYAAAVDLLVELHRRPPPAGLAPYDAQLLQQEADLLVDWYLPRKRARPTAEPLKEEYRALWRALYPLAEDRRPVLVLRDYHADNLIWLPGRRGIARVGLLDFQDAVAGASAYDLVSLLEDARRDVPPAIVEAAIARYLAASPDLDAESLRTAYAVLGAQRNCKILGIFTRLSVRDGKPQYLDYLPRVWRLLENDLAHPALRPLRDWLAREAPPMTREREG